MAGDVTVGAGLPDWSPLPAASDATAAGRSARSVGGERASVRGTVLGILAKAPLVILPLCIFLAFFHPDILRVHNFGWLIEGTDNGENALGAHAYWHDKAAGASLNTGLLNAPEGVPVLYTDSNPLLTLIVKPFAALLPADMQLVGPFILLSLCLQALFAWLLLRRRAPGTIALWAGVALLAFPPTLAHRYIHVNLMAHWTILAALCLFLDKDRGTRLTWWAPLIAVTTLIHSYLLFMVAAIWASAMLARFKDGTARIRIAVAGQCVVVLAMVAVLARWLGVKDQMSTSTFGAFRMPIDALWNPRIATYSTLLPNPSHHTANWFEGFQYLGAGGLLLVAAAIAVGRFLPARDGERADVKRLRDLAPALITLTILAVAQLPLPAFAMAALDPVRASGRLFWPVGYVLVLVAIFAVYRLSPRNAALALVGMVALQVVDLSGMASMIRSRSARIDGHQPYNRTLDPRWAGLIARSRSVAFMPDDVTADLDLFQEVAWRAIDADRPVTNVYAARISRASASRVAAEQRAFWHGTLVPGRLYVMLPGAILPAAARPYAMTLDGTTVVAPYRFR